jgi:uncharacterized protein YciI
MSNKFASLSCAAVIIAATDAFLPAPVRSSSRRPLAIAISTASPPLIAPTRLLMSFVADSSDYKADRSDFGDGPDDDPDSASAPLRGEVDMADVPVTEEVPVPMSRNNVGNRFVAVVFDGNFDGSGEKDPWEMHDDRIALTERHVIWARKQNLYNDTFNVESRADVLWSHQLLSSDLQRTVGHAMCIDSPTIDDCREALSRDPIVRSLLGVDPATGACDASRVPLYRWRQIRDHTLRRDDGRDGLPNMVLAFDRPEATSDGLLREEVSNDHLEYLIRSERVIAAGPLHVATPDKTDPTSVPVGTLLFFNAADREDAIGFAEDDPAARAGLYETITVHRFNSLDVTGKFVSENLYFLGQNTYQMKEAMEYWGYPVDDLQTRWLNW